MRGLLRLGSAAGMPPTRLLISVASAAEVEPAVAGGADIVDVKDPSTGALGRPSPQCLAEVVACVGGRAPVTAAWGELAEATPLDVEQRQSLRGVSLVKLGTAHLGEQEGTWRERWESVRDSVPPGIAIAIVHYADWHRSGALDIEATLALAEEAKAVALVIDTYGKAGGGLLDFYPPPQLATIVHQIRSRQLAIVLAGSLHASHLLRVLDCTPAVVGVRGAACQQGHRNGPICSERVAALRNAIDRYQLQGRSSKVGNPPVSG